MTKKGKKREQVIKERPAQLPKTLPQPTRDEIGGPEGLEPTRYGDWERKGRVSDF